MSKPKAPAPPDPVATAQAQYQYNTQAAQDSARLNRVNQQTPYGSVSYTEGPGMRWTQTVTESPNQERLRLAQENSGIALGELGAAQARKVGDILGTNYQSRRFNSADVTGGRFDPNAAAGQDIESATYDLATRRLGTQFDRSEEQLRSRLANQGITQDSEAFRSELEAFNTGKGNAYADAQLQARSTAEASRAARIAEALQGRQQNLAEGEAQYARDTAADMADRRVPLEEISSIINGAPLQRTDPGQIYTQGINAADYQGAVAMQQQALQNQYNQKMAGRNAIIGGLAGLGGAALGAGTKPWWMGS